MLKSFSHRSYLMFLFRQLDNDDGDQHEKREEIAANINILNKIAANITY